MYPEDKLTLDLLVMPFAITTIDLLYSNYQDFIENEENYIVVKDYIHQKMSLMSDNQKGLYIKTLCDRLKEEDVEEKKIKMLTVFYYSLSKLDMELFTPENHLKIGSLYMHIVKDMKPSDEVLLKTLVTFCEKWEERSLLFCLKTYVKLPGWIEDRVNKSITGL